MAFHIDCAVKLSYLEDLIVFDVKSVRYYYSLFLSFHVCLPMHMVALHAFLLFLVHKHAVLWDVFTSFCSILFVFFLQTVIARRSDMLVMSSDGPLGAYVNVHGSVHEVMTFRNANGLALRSPPVKEYSWFPGYALNSLCLA